MTLTFCYSLAIIDVIAHMTIIANESIIVKIAVFLLFPVGSKHRSIRAVI
jgi:hypothetical protein